MSLEVAPYADRRRQPTVAVVAGTPERLAYITNNGEFREGDPETLWKELAVRECYQTVQMNRGKPRPRWVTGSPPIVVSAKRGSIRDLVRTCDARHWVGLRSTHGKYKTLEHEGGPTVRRLGVNADLVPAAEALFTFVDFLNSHGVRFSGSISGAGFSLFRTTLTAPIRFWSPPNAANALWPGRREYWHEPRTWYGMGYFDLKAAYPAALMESGIPTAWHQVDPEKWRGHPDGFSAARTFTPYDHTPPHPLPLRLRPGSRRESISWAKGSFSGVWTHRDMANADDVDISVTADECWVPTKWTDAFSSDRWLALRAEMRGLPGLAGVLGKIADNSLWGMFAFDSSADIRIRWETKDGDMSKTTESKASGVRKVHGVGVALAATSRVRQHLWKGIHQTDAIYCDTDGLIAPDTAKPSPANGGDGTWYLKQKLGVIDIKAPQCYRYLNADDVDWHYLGESSPANFLSSMAYPNQMNGDELGTAPPLSVRQAYLLGLMNDDT